MTRLMTAWATVAKGLSGFMAKPRYGRRNPTMAAVVPPLNWLAKRRPSCWKTTALLMAETSASRRLAASASWVSSSETQELVGVLVRPDGQHAGRVDLVEDGDQGVEIVGRRQRISLQRAGGSECVVGP